MRDAIWMQPPAGLRLGEDVVDVWRADLSDAGDAERALLSPAEQERAGRFARAADGRRWAGAHGILRALLARYDDTDPRTLRFVLGPHGKPALAGVDGRAAEAAGEQPTAGGGSLRFNLSHSGDVALLAFARGREVGVDVELPRRPVDAVAIAARVLGPAEARRLAALDPPAREREFLRAWVRYEAVLKCRGTGIGGAGAAEADDGPEPWLRELDVGSPGAAAVAVEGGACAVRCWRWRAGGALPP